VKLRPSLALAVAFAASPLASAATAVELRIPSRMMGGPVKATVLLPPSYESASARRFPVLYFLHDGRGDERTLFAHGVADELLAEMRSGAVPEMLVVSPRIAGTWCVDSWDGKRKAASFLDQELVPFIEARYRVIPERRGRAVAGISMGGYGAVHWALRSPSSFAAVGAVSPALQQMSWETLTPLPPLTRLSFTRVFGRSETANSLRENDVYDMLLRDPGLAARVAPVYVRCGTEDHYRLSEISAFFGRFLDALRVPNRVTLEPGRHDWAYWSRSLMPLLRDVAARLAPGASS
jgi:S-formylglutathione hydrolase FrmB